MPSSPARELRRLVLIALEDLSRDLAGNGTMAELRRKFPRHARSSLVVALRWLEAHGYVVLRKDKYSRAIVGWVAKLGALRHYLAQLEVLLEQEEARRQWNADLPPHLWRPVPPRPKWPESFEYVP